MAMLPAAFRRLCVETHPIHDAPMVGAQPPSGGCVLKLGIHHSGEHFTQPAAFRRLCVETEAIAENANNLNVPAAFRRLCVETSWPYRADTSRAASRLQAAVC